MTPTAPTRDPASAPLPNWVAPLSFVALLVLALWTMTRAWDASLLDRFQFRQTQTALTTYWIQRDGFHLAYLMPVFGPPWSAPMEFPLYQAIVAALANATGLSLVSAARGVGIACFLGSLPAIAGLARAVEIDRRRRWLIVGAVLSAPVCLFYARSVMIESCAAALGVWFLHAYVQSLRRPGVAWILVTAACGTLAALVKVTTFVLFGLPAAGVTIYFLLRILRTPPAARSSSALRQLMLVAAIPAVASGSAAIWWVSFSDGIKGSNPIAEMLTSTNLSAWHYGTLAQRLDPAFWKIVAHHWSTGAVSGWATLLLALATGFIAPLYRRAALLTAAGFFLGPLIFTNLHAIHEYYYFPSAFFATAAAGIVLAGVIAAPRLPPAVKIAVPLVFFSLQALSFNSDYTTTLKHRPAPPPPMVNVVQRATATDEVVLVYGWDWNTLIPYYAERRAILMPPSREDKPAVLQEVLSRLKPGEVTTLVLQGPHKTDAAFIKWCTSLLNLSSTPVARSPDGDIYLAASRVPLLQSTLAGQLANYPGIEFNFDQPVERPDPRLIFAQPNPADYAGVASPAPFATYNPWSIQVAPIAGAPGISANAPSELHFHVPPGATRIEAIVGIVAGAYTPPNATDGIDVAIFELLPTGGRRILYQRFLNPVANPADRDLQTITLENIGPCTGPLVFGLYPGPADNIAFDWGFWRKISIQ